MEETGIDSELKLEFSFKKGTSTDNENCKFFTYHWDGYFRMSEKEFDEMKFFNLAELKKVMGNGSIKVAPGATITLREFIKRRGV